MDNDKNEKLVAKGSTGNISVLNQTVRTVLGIQNEKRDSSSDDEYGPKLPESMTQSSIVISSDSEDLEWVDKSKKSKKKNKKKDKKSKKKKKKKYESRSVSRSRTRSRDRDYHHKHKKRKRSYSSSSS